MTRVLILPLERPSDRVGQELARTTFSLDLIANSDYRASACCASYLFASWQPMRDFWWRDSDRRREIPSCHVDFIMRYSFLQIIL
jgi:hypothetical protein